MSEIYKSQPLETRINQNLSLSFNKEDLDNILCGDKYSPEKLVNIFKRDFGPILSKDIDENEGYSLENKVLSTLKHFDTAYRNQDLPFNMDKDFFRIIIVIREMSKQGLFIIDPFK